jgi:hypothetical protein
MLFRTFSVSISKNHVDEKGYQSGMPENPQIGGSARCRTRRGGGADARWDA